MLFFIQFRKQAQCTITERYDEKDACSQGGMHLARSHKDQNVASPHNKAMYLIRHGIKATGEAAYKVCIDQVARKSVIELQVEEGVEILHGGVFAR